VLSAERGSVPSIGHTSSTRRIIRLRYDSRNYACLCFTCHTDGHADPEWFRGEWARIKGEDVVEWLMRERNKVEPIRESFYREVFARTITREDHYARKSEKKL